MKKFLITLLLFGGLFFIYDKLFIVIRNIAPKYQSDKRLELLLEGELNKDLIILGSSRAQSNISAWVLEDKLSLSSFNLGYGGSSPEFQVFILRKLLQNNTKPKIIIKEIDDDFELFEYDENGNGKGFRYDRLYPLVKYPEIREILIEKGDKNVFLSFLFVQHQIYKQNFNIRKAKLNDTVKRYGAKASAGYDKTLDWHYDEEPGYNFNSESVNQVKAFKELQEICAENRITLIYAVSTGYRKMNKQWLERMEELVFPGTQIFIPRKDELSKNEIRIFSDLSHRNLKGADLYTNQLVQFIKDSVALSNKN